MAIRYILFDLDGTLTDSALGITNCATYALKKFGIFPTSTAELLPYIGPPLMDSFKEFHGLSQDQAQQAVIYYRERFSKIGWRENEVFDGIPSLLKELNDRGVALMVATSKPEEFTCRILEHFDLRKYFEFVAGSTLDGQRSGKADVIAYIRGKFPEMTAENTVMIGDRKYDVIGAHSQNLPAVGVLYGYGDRDEMKAAGADFIVEDVVALQQLLLPMTEK